LSALIDRVIALQDYTRHYSFIEKLIELKKITITCEDGNYTFTENQKTYTYNKQKYSIFFLKLDYYLNGDSTKNKEIQSEMNWLNSEIEDCKKINWVLDDNA
jgi:hypothetical protein